MRQMLGSAITTTYGMTETSGGCVFDGRPLSDVRITIDETDDRIWIAGPMLASCYRDDRPDSSSGALSDGWLRTNDRGRWAAGALQVLGRLDDIVTVNGVNVDIVSIEDRLRDHPDVTDALVIGIPHEGSDTTLHAAYIAGTTRRYRSGTTRQLGAREIGTRGGPSHIPSPRMVSPSPRPARSIASRRPRSSASTRTRLDRWEGICCERSCAVDRWCTPSDPAGRCSTGSRRHCIGRPGMDSDPSSPRVDRRARPASRRQLRERLQRRHQGHRSRTSGAGAIGRAGAGQTKRGTQCGDRVLPDRSDRRVHPGRTHYAVVVACCRCLGNCRCLALHRRDHGPTAMPGSVKSSSSSTSGWSRYSAPSMCKPNP
jgi:hypothetical protein